ncbi:TetM/TetW/TetO/TetS family tetracycline resistance ribosomal protection protein [Micromonospora sp. WMMD812]|uniref:elongation factor G n=1 Tax=Micromonospora sp. WMMD812 TaxID=3015152 RepID=UPI00248D0B20|nr:TetM/TetW/TetO/TetS family tetracycline resistance ribosomal protection protein [Micromonospora sp. WMMD812]WBB69424.1 TetM/TetW/TetO/TetS family tetracycline resistance ribosomal protection protein [Micromonospora sp. WMMD812]
MTTLNVGILAHVDAGKTSLTERLLHTVGVTDEVGSVDDGTTRTDTLALERQRGITIRSAVVSFVVDGVTVNLIDTPGHPDFIAEVERVLDLLDGVVLVVSAVEGVQAQTRVLMRTLQRLRLPTLIFINKIDRAGADPERVLRDIADRLAPSVVATGAVRAAGTADACFVPHADGDPGFTRQLLDRLTAGDDRLLAEYVADERRLTGRRLRAALAAQSRRALVHPVYAGSAITGAGVAALVDGLTTLLPTGGSGADGPASGTVFKVERGPSGEKLAYVRMFGGTVRLRDRLAVGGRVTTVTGIEVFDLGSRVRADAVAAGRIALLRGLGDVRIGDPVGAVRHGTAGNRHFASPSLETVVVPERRTDQGALYTALSELAEQDPLINVRRDAVRGDISVSLYGEVQKEVIQATLAEEYGLAVGFRETTAVYVERLVGAGAAVELIGVAPNPFLATVGLRVAPGEPGGGITFRLGVELGSMPPAFFTAVEETVRSTLRQGLHGWQVLDCAVTMTHSGYWARQSHSHGTFDKSMSSTAGDFRNLTPLVLIDALTHAGTRVEEPVHRFRLEVPTDVLAAVLPVLAGLEAVPHSTLAVGRSSVVEGVVPARRVHAVERRLPALTRGEAIFEATFDHHRPVRGEPPSRPRWDHNPTDRKEYLLAVNRRVARRGER